MFDYFSILLVFVVWVSQQTQPGSCPLTRVFSAGPKCWPRNGGRWRRRRPETKTFQDFVGLTRESSKESVGVCWRARHDTGIVSSWKIKILICIPDSSDGFRGTQALRVPSILWRSQAANAVSGNFGRFSSDLMWFVHFWIIESILAFSGLIAFWSACLSSRQELLPGGTCLENLRCPLHSFWPRSIGGSVRFFFEAYFQGFESIFSHPPNLHPIACSWFKLLLEPAPKEMRHRWRDQRKIFPTSCFSGQLSAFQQDAADLSVLLKWRQYVQMYFI